MPESSETLRRAVLGACLRRRTHDAARETSSTFPRAVAINHQSFDTIADHHHAALRKAGGDGRAKAFHRLQPQQNPAQHACGHPMANDKHVLFKALVGYPVKQSLRDIVIKFAAVGTHRKQLVLHIYDWADFRGYVGISTARPKPDVNFQQPVVAHRLVPVGVDFLCDQRKRLQRAPGGGRPKLRRGIIPQIVCQRTAHRARLHTAFPCQRCVHLRLALHSRNFVKDRLAMPCDEKPSTVR